MRKCIYICDLCGKESENGKMFHDITVSSEEVTKIQSKKIPISKNMEICNNCFNSLFINKDFISRDVW